MTGNNARFPTFSLVTRLTSGISNDLLVIRLFITPNFRGILENAGTMIGQRSLQWDLRGIYPGLCLRVGPTADSNSVLEFVMDPNLERGDRYLVEEPSTGKVTIFLLSSKNYHSRFNFQLEF